MIEIAALSLLLALTIGMSAGLLFDYKGPWNHRGALIFVLFLVIWLSMFWADPSGPSLWGVSLLPGVFMGLFFTLLLAAITKGQPADKSALKIDSPPSGEGTDTYALGGLMFWLLVGTLAMALVLSHYSRIYILP